MNMQKMIFTLLLFWLVGCSSSVAEPVAIERPSQTPTILPSPTQLMATATTQPTNTPELLPTQTAVPSPTAIPTQPPTPMPPLLTEIPIGLVYQTANTNNNESFIMTETGFEPFENDRYIWANGRYTLQTRLIEEYEYSTTEIVPFPPDKQLILTDNDTQTEQIILPNVVGASLADWWPAEPDWFVIQEAQTEEIWSPWVGPLHLSVARLDGTETHSLFAGIATERLAAPPAINPLGEDIVFAAWRGELWHYTLSNNQRTVVDATAYGLPVDFSWEEISWLEWSPNGRYLAISSIDNYLILLDIENKTSQPIAFSPDFRFGLADEGWSTQFAWSPDSQHIVLKGHQLQPEEIYGLWVWQLETETLTHLASTVPHLLTWADAKHVMSKTGTTITLHHIDLLTSEQVPISYAHISSDRRYIVGVSASQNAIPLLFDVQTRELYRLDIKADIQTLWWP